MAFTPKDWRDYPEITTPISAAALEDLETRLSDYSDTVGGAGTAALTELTDVTGTPDVYGQDVPTWNGAAFEFASRGERINLADYGAKGDGETNDNQAFIDALSAAATLASTTGHATVFGRPGAVYLLTGGASTPRFIIPSRVTLDLNGSTCDLSGSADFSIGFGATGTVPSSGTGYEALSGNVTKGDWEVACTNGAEFADGDWVKIGSEATDGSGTGKIGEINRVVVPVGHCAAMNDSQDTITLGATAANLFGNTNSGGGQVQIDDELIDYTSATSATISGCTRGVGITDPAAHSAGSLVTFVPASTQVLLQNKIVNQHGYATADTAFIKKITEVSNATIRNGKIRGPGADGGLAFIAIRWIYCVNTRVENVDFEGCNSINVSLNNTVFSTVDTCSMHKSLLANPATANLGYGILLYDGTQDCTISNNRIMRMRHCIAHGNSEYGYPRRNIFIGNHFLYSSGDVFDTHSPTDDIHIIGNVFIGGNNGVFVLCPRATIIGNHFEYQQSAAITCTFTHISPAQWKIHGNKMMKSEEYAVTINADTVSSDGVDFIQFTENSIDCGTKGGLLMGYASGDAREGVVISNNVIANCPESYEAMDIGGMDGAVISNNLINRPHANTTGLLLVNSTKCSVTGNVVRFDSVGTGKGIDFDNCDDVVVSGNVVANAATGINTQSDCTYIQVTANNTRGCTATVNLNGVITNTGDPTAPVVTIDSATETTLPTNGTVFHIAGTTTITSVTESYPRVVTLIFDGILTFSDGGNIKLNTAGSDFVTSADDTITLAFDGSYWHEIARSAN